jgi:hypothetical protein
VSARSSYASAGILVNKEGMRKLFLILVLSLECVPHHEEDEYAHEGESTQTASNRAAQPSGVIGTVEGRNPNYGHRYFRLTHEEL